MVLDFNMTKYFAIFLAFILIIALTACSFADNKNSSDLFCIVYENNSHGPFLEINSDKITEFKKYDKRQIQNYTDDSYFQGEGLDFSLWCSKNYYLYKNSKIAGAGKVSGAEYYVNVMDNSNISTIKINTPNKSERYIAYSKKVNPCRTIKYDNNKLNKNILEYYTSQIAKKFNLPVNDLIITVNFIADIDNDNENEVFVNIDRPDYGNLYVYFIADLKNDDIINIKFINYFDKEYIGKEYEAFFDVIDLDNDGSCEILNFVGPYYQETVSIYKVDNKSLKLLLKTFIMTTS